MSDLVGNPEDWFSCFVAQIPVGILVVPIHVVASYIDSICCYLRDWLSLDDKCASRDVDSHVLHSINSSCQLLLKGCVLSTGKQPRPCLPDHYMALGVNN